MRKILFLLYFINLNVFSQDIMRFTVPNTSNDDHNYYKHQQCINPDPDKKGLHFGIDTWAASGSVIKSPAHGIVEFVISQSTSCNTPYCSASQRGKDLFCNIGYTVGIRHERMSINGSSLYSMFLHMQSPPLVNQGDQVKIGQIVGYIGQTGGSNCIDHTHFETRNFNFNSQTTNPYHDNLDHIYGYCTSKDAPWILSNWEDPETITIPNFGQTIYAGNASNPQNIQIIFKAPEWASDQTFSENSITNIQINDASITENVTGGTNISRFSNLGNNWYSFDLNLPSGRAWVNGSNYDLRFNITTSTRSLRAFGSGTVKFSNGNFTDTNFNKRWVSEYASKAALLGLIGGSGSSYGNDDTEIDFATAARLVVNAGIKLRILSNNSAGLAGSFDNLVPINIPKSDASYYYFQILNNWGYIIPTGIAPSDQITTGQLTDMLTATFGITDATNNPLLNVINLTPASNCTSADNKLKTKYIFRTQTRGTVLPFAEAILKCDHLNTNPMTKAILTKILVNTFEYKHQVNFQVSPNSNARIAAINSTSDFQIIGNKKEFNANPSGNTLPQNNNETINMTAGLQRTFSFPDVTIDGQPVSCYWSVDGGVLQQFGAAPYFQSIKWTAPTVTTQTTFTLYMYATTAGGYASESFKTIFVNPASSAFSISTNDQDLCFGESTTLVSSNCSGTIQWDGLASSNTTVNITPISNTTYYAFCNSGGSSVKSNEIYIIVNPKPNAPNLNATLTYLQPNQSTTITASGCNGVVNWSDGLGQGSSKTVIPTSTTIYSATCIRNNCTSNPANITIQVNSINCGVGEPNDVHTSAFNLGEYNSDVTASSYNNQFCFTENDITDWYKIKIYDKIYFIKVSDPENGCSTGCPYYLHMELIANNLSIEIASPYYFNLDIYDSNGTTLLASDTKEPGGTLLINLNVCSALSAPIDKTRDYKCGTTGGMFIEAEHHLENTTHYINDIGNYFTDIEWFDSPTSTTILHRGDRYSAPAFEIPKTFYASLRISPTCTSARTPIFVDIYPRADAPILTATKTTISNGESTALTATGCAGTVDWWYNNLGNSNPLIVSPTSTTLYQANCVGQPCYSYSSQITVTVVDVTTPIINSSQSEICVGQSITLTATNCNGIVTWNNNLGTGTPKSVSPSQNTIYTAYCSLDGTNSGNSNEVSVTVNTLSGGAISPATQTICQDQSIGVSRLLNEPFVLSGYSGQILRWEFKTPNSDWIDWGQAGVESPSDCCFGPILGTWKVRAVIGNGVCSSIYSSEATVEVIPLASAIISGTQTIRAGFSATLSVALTGSAPWTVIVNGTSYSATASPFTFSVTPNSTTTYIITSVSNSCGTGTASGTAVVTVTPGTEMAAVYPFNANSNDESGNNLHLTNTNAVLTTDRHGVADRAYYFNGTAKLISPNVSYLYNTSFSISYWAKPDTYTGLMLIRTGPPSTNGALHIALRNANTYTFAFYNNDYDFTNFKKDNQWHQYIMIYDKSVAVRKVYEDGILIGTQACNSALFTQNSPLVLGYSWDTNYADHYIGKLDDIRIYRRPLSATEVTTIYNQEKPCNVATATLSGTQTINAGQSANLTVTLTGTAPWTIVMNGTNYSTNTSPFSISVRPNTSTTYNLTSVSNSCGIIGTVSGSAVVTVIPTCITPSAPTTTSASRCGAGTVILTSSGCSGTYNWYAASSGGISLASTANYTTPSISGTTNYYVSCKVGSCISTRTLATATVKTIPPAPTLTANPASITSGQSSTLTASNCSGTVNWSNNLGTGASKLVSPLSSTTYTATCTVNGCISGSASTIVTVNNCPNQPDLLITTTNITKYASNMVNYAVTIKNQGSINASLGSVSLGVFGSTDAIRNSNDVFKSAIFAGGGTLSPGQTFVINDFASFNFTSPYYFLAFSIDYHSLLSECNEANNSFVKLVNACSWPNNSQIISWSGRFTQPFYAANFPIQIPNFLSSVHKNVLFVAPSITIPPVFNSQTFTAIPGRCFDAFINGNTINEVSELVDNNPKIFTITEDISYILKNKSGIEFLNKPEKTLKISLVNGNNGSQLFTFSPEQKFIDGSTLEKGVKYFVIFETENGGLSEGFEWE